MKLITVVVMSSVALAGCGKQENPLEHVAKFGGTQAAKPEEAKPELSAFKTRALAELAKITEFKDAMCKCRDRACATKVHEDHEAWTNAQPPDHTKPGPGEEAEMIGKLKTVFDEERACVEKAIASSSQTKQPELKPSVRKAMAKASGFRDAMCKCSAGDTACAQRVMKAFEEMPSEHDPDYGAAESAEFKRLAQPVMKEYAACMMTAMTPPESSKKPSTNLKATIDAAVAQATKARDAICKCSHGDTGCMMTVTRAQMEWARSEAAKDVTNLNAADREVLMEKLGPIIAAHQKCVDAIAGT